LKISNLKTHFPKVPFLALTATPRVKEDIIKELGLKEPQLLRNRLQGKILLTWFLKKINSFESNKFLEKHPILHNLCPKQKVLYRNFIPLHSLGLRQLIIMADLHQGKKNMQLGWTIRPRLPQMHLNGH
jgi:hypothetical protein